ncbi:diguanylate cyclase [Geodermatophilus sp. URMC 64]
MLPSVVHRGSAVLRRGVAVHADPADVPASDVPATGRRADEELSERASLRELIAAAPELRAELHQRGRASALLIVTFAALVLPAWTGFDVLLEPELVGPFALVRLLCAAPMLVALWLLWRHPVGRRHPQRITVAVLTLVQLDIVWMATQVTHAEAYAMGLSLALYGSGCILSGRPRWTGALVAVTALAFAGAALLGPEPMSPQTLGIVGYYLATASLISVVAHVLRQRIAVRELRARVRLEREQERTRGLLARLDRLSHEDPLTGLANRRRWDAELSTGCAEARERGTGLAVVLLDIDHFKDVNDRHGHAGGDEALRQVAALLRRSVRGTDLVARLGGDELAVLMPGADLARAAELAEAVRAAAAELQPTGFAPGEVSLSLGVGVAAGSRAYPLELMASADAQLYRAKITRNSVGAPTAEPAR